MDKDYTFVGPRGISVVDYVITTPDVFSKIDQFIVANFTMYSDHAPLHIRLKSKIQINSNSTVLGDSENQLSSQFVWNQDLIHQAQSALIENSDDLVTCFQNTLCETQSSIDESVDLFTLRLTDLMRPFFEINKRSPKPVHNSGGARSHSYVKALEKPWFNEDLRKKYRIYRSALTRFNNTKSRVNHLNLIEGKRNYKRSEAKLERQYLRKEGNLLDHLRKDNPKIFHKHFRKRKPKHTSIELDLFRKHFEDLSTFPTNMDSDPPVDTGTTVFEELDIEISEKEISDAIDNLKRDKSHGLDYILNEYFIEFKGILMPYLHSIFNRILLSGYFSTQWSDAVIVPVFKKNDPADPNNYRGISLISCFCKLFTAILNRRLILLASSNSIVTDVQFGFQPMLGTTEAIFALHCLVSQALQTKKRFYCCVVDYKKAFDSINREKLYRKLKHYGIQGKLLVVIRSMYSRIRTCVNSSGRISNFFENHVGLLQGEVLSPMLFVLYVNDLENEFIKKGTAPTDLAAIIKSLSSYVCG